MTDDLDMLIGPCSAALCRQNKVTVGSKWRNVGGSIVEVTSLSILVGQSNQGMVTFRTITQRLWTCTIEDFLGIGTGYSIKPFDLITI